MNTDDASIRWGAIAVERFDAIITISGHARRDLAAVSRYHGITPFS